MKECNSEAATARRILTDIDIQQEPRWGAATTSLPDQSRGGYFGTFLHAWRVAAMWDSGDVVVTGNIRNAAMFGLLKRLNPFKQPRLLSVETRFDNPRPGLFWHAKLLYQRFAFKAVDAICVSAQREIGMYSARLKLPTDRFHFVPWHTNVIEPHDLFVPEGYVFAAGRTGRDWNTLAAAASRVDSKIVVVMTRSDAAKVSFPDNVEVHTDIPYQEYRSLLERAAIVVVPLSVNDYSSGQVGLLEAMALGKPTVCSDVLGTEDYVVDGENGLLVTPENVEALVSALRRLQDQHFSERLGSEALRTVLKCHTFPHYVDSILRHAAG